MLREQGLRLAPRTHRAWKRNPPSLRVAGDAAVVDKLRHLRTGGPKGGPLPEVLYGRRKMTAWLARNGLPVVPEHTVGRLIAISSRTTWRCSRARGGGRESVALRTLAASGPFEIRDGEDGLVPAVTLGRTLYYIGEPSGLAVMLWRVSAPTSSYVREFFAGALLQAAPRAA